MLRVHSHKVTHCSPRRITPYRLRVMVKVDEAANHVCENGFSTSISDKVMVYLLLLNPTRRFSVT